MIVMQKIKFMQEFTSAINEDYLHSNLKVKLLMHNCARAKHANTCCVAYKGVVWKTSAYDTHIQEK